MHSKTKIIPVVAAALMRPDGSFMLGSRPAGKPYAGYWEFPGGKVEAGESLLGALARELQEEMAISLIDATPWLTRVHHYEHALVALHFFRVWSWSGEPQPCEGQAFAWQQPGAESVSPMLPANASILRSLTLPDTLTLCPRVPAVEVAPAPRQGWLWQDGATGGALCFNLGGRLECGRVWPLSALAVQEGRPAADWVGAEVESAAALAQAAALGCDFALVAANDWATFDRVVADGLPLPVFARGAESLAEARRHGAHGVVEEGVCV